MANTRPCCTGAIETRSQHMKRLSLAFLALTAAGIAAMSVPAKAASYTSGNWYVYDSTSDLTGKPLCGMNIGGSDTRVISVKYFAHDNTVRVQAFKDSWRFPKDSV